jgi:hypothetical protein
MTAREVLVRAGRRFDSLQSRVLAVTVLILLVVMAGVIIVVEARQRAAIIGEVLRRGEVITRDLAAVSSSPLLLYNFTALEQNVDRVRANTDVVYAIVLDAEGRVVAHSRRPELVGRVLTAPADARAVQADALLVQETNRGNRAEGIFDFAVPVLVGAERWGTVRVGLSKRRMEAQIRRTRIELAGLTSSRSSWSASPPLSVRAPSRGRCGSSPRARRRSRAGTSITGSPPPGSARSASSRCCSTT